MLEVVVGWLVADDGGIGPSVCDVWVGGRGLVARYRPPENTDWVECTCGSPSTTMDAYLTLE